MLFRLVLSVAVSAALTLASSTGSAAETPHTFVLTYRDFGPVTGTGTFKKADGYEVRFEGCFAKHSEEAICGFTIRSAVPLTLTNAQNASHGADAAGSAIRTCCLFIQGDNRGFPISAASGTTAGAAILNRVVQPGEALGVMLRVPSYKAFGPLTAITFSRGQGDLGVQFPAHIIELP
jgi:hypothetical protein